MLEIALEMLPTRDLADRSGLDRHLEEQPKPPRITLLVREQQRGNDGKKKSLMN
jgi:hypothetical protein